MTTRLHEDLAAVESAPEGDAEEPTTIDFRDPTFLANAYDTYARLRAEGPVSRVHFALPEPEDAQERGRQEFFARDVYLVTHYDEGNAALLDSRFSVDRLRTMPPEQREELERAAEADSQFL